jgi:hypothetical protein
MAGTRDQRRVLVTDRPLLVVALACALIIASLATTARTAHADVGNLSGDWHIVFNGPPILDGCEAVVSHGGPSLQIDGTCAPPLSGTINNQTGVFSIYWSGATGYLVVTATATDTTMSGTYGAQVSGGPYFQGPFSGTRLSVAPPPVGGVAELPGLAALPAAAEAERGRNDWPATAIAVAVVALGSIAGAGWWALIAPRRKR